MRAGRVFAALVALAASGCSTVGNGALRELAPAQAQALLVPGRTTEAEVRAALGDAAVIRFDSGRTTWRYDDRRGLGKGWDAVPYVNLVAARLDAPIKELVLLFDADGRLLRWSLQTYRARHDAGAP